MTWLDVQGRDGGDEFRAMLGLQPLLLSRYEELEGRIWRSGGPDPRLLELCRLRIAQLHGSAYDRSLRYEPALAAGLGEETIAALPDYATAPLFTDAERRALAFAEHYVMDVHGITDEEFAAVAADLTPAGMTAFTFALGIFDGLTRLRAILDLRPASDQPRVVRPATEVPA